MKKLKVYSPLKLKKGQPAGGGNQFLVHLFQALDSNIHIEKEVRNAEVVLCNSYQILNGRNPLEWYRELKVISQKKVIHRVAGPIHKMRDKHKVLDRFIYTFNRFFASHTIFQSKYSLNANISAGMKPGEYSTIINATDGALFHPDQSQRDSKAKTKLIATSWSNNKKKGLSYFKFLDSNIDTERFEVTFIGNIQHHFKNIKVLPPMTHKNLSEVLRSNDIFIFPSENDPCPNSLIEALASGLPAVALDSGGAPELIKDGGELFKSPDEMLSKIELVSNNNKKYRDRIPQYTLNNVAGKYLNILMQTKKCKQANSLQILYVMFLWAIFKINEKYLTRP